MMTYMARARSTDPQESHDAAAKVSVGTQRAIVMRTLYKHPNISDNELIEFTEKLPASHSGLRSRRSELIKDGFVKKSGSSVSKYGKRCGLFSLTDKGLYLMSGGKEGRNE